MRREGREGRKERIERGRVERQRNKRKRRNITREDDCVKYQINLRIDFSFVGLNN